MNGCSCRGWCSSGAEPSRSPRPSRREDTKIAQDKRSAVLGQHRKLVFAPRRGRGEEFNYRPSCSIKRPPCLAAPVHTDIISSDIPVQFAITHTSVPEDSDGLALSDSIAIGGLIFISLVLGSFFTVNTAQVAIITRFGKFLRVAEAGLTGRRPTSILWPASSVCVSTRSR